MYSTLGLSNLLLNNSNSSFSITDNPNLEAFSIKDSLVGSVNESYSSSVTATRPYFDALVWINSEPGLSIEFFKISYSDLGINS